MREIKFRSVHFTFDDRFSHFSYWGFINHKGEFDKGCFASPSQNNQTYRKFENQFTGLKDKNGEEIWEGDIIKRHLEFWTDPADIGGTRLYKKDLINIIEWGVWCYIKREKLNSPCTSFDRIEAREYEKIGNIYENPELLGLTDKK